VTKRRVAIAGATGYTGYELWQILRRHPHVEIVALTSEQSAGAKIGSVFWTADAQRNHELIALAELNPRDVDTVFLCLPHQGAADWLAANPNQRPQVIDLSADFRLRDPDAYDQWYGFTHPLPPALSEAVYGLTELNRASLVEAELIANPGCYPTCSLLALAPLLRGGAIDGGSPVIIDAKSGVSGAGRKATLTNSFVEVNENLSPYAVGNTHRHVPEIQQGLTMFGGQKMELIFTPHLIPLSRGMICTTYARLANGNTIQHARAILEEQYADAHFVHLLKEGAATVAHAARTNHCVISLHQTEEHLVVISAIDNLLKGASGQAVQNFNVSQGFDEREGIL
jgi:N-acetyl-gamma-glutamyl-phosphate reductase